MTKLALVVLLLASPATAQSIDPAAVHVVASPNVLSWPVTQHITAIDVEAQGMRVTLDRCGAWPPVTPPGWTGPLTHTLWLFMSIGGEWYASGIIQFWDCAAQFNGGPIYQENQIARNWVYGTQWAPMTGHQPQPGERIAFMVSAGNARMQDDHVVAERSDIVEVAMPSGPGIIPFAPVPSPPIVTPPPVVVPPVFTQPAPAPAPAPVPSPQPPPVLPAVDLSGLYAQLAAMNAKLETTAQEVHTLKTEVEANWTRYAGPIMKYGSAVLMGVLAHWKLSAAKEIAK